MGVCSFPWRSLCPTSPASRTSGIYGHLTLQLPSRTFSKRPPPTHPSPRSRGWAPSQALCTPQRRKKNPIPATRGRKSKRKYIFVVQCRERSPGQENPKRRWFLLPSKVIFSPLLKMCLSWEQWTEMSRFPHECIRSHAPVGFFCAISVAGTRSRACTIPARVQDRQKTD